jgi:6-phosphogluconolactonase (cycloisomerase 2 family)
MTVFSVRGDRLSRLQVVSTGGAFPVSVTTHGNVVYVLNARDGGSIQGFVRIGSRLVKVPSWHRALGLPVTTGDQEFTHTPGQVAFTPDGAKLVVTTKAATNSIDVFGIDRFGAPSAQPTVTAVPGAVPFAATFDDAGRLAVAEAGPNAIATFTVHANGKLTQVDQATTGQTATCWIAGANGVLYAANAGSGNVSAFRDSHGRLTSLGTTATAAGSVDVATSPDGRRLYAQTGQAGVVVSFRINRDGSLTRTGSTTVPNATGGEGLAAG